ncbi:MAG: PaaI family thioesterase [Acidimicrobiales bacterium]
MTIADRFAPLPHENAERWGHFPTWDQPTNFAMHLGFVVEELRQDYARLRLPARQEMNQPAGIMHGGAIASLIDTTVVPAVGWNVTGRNNFVTISMDIQYLSAVAGEDAVCEGWIEKRGKSICFCRAEVRGADTGNLCATASLVYKV